MTGTARAIVMNGATVTLRRMRLRIDELAARTGTTSRNIRAYQARGLLHPPQLDGRTGYYDDEHVRRLEIIDELQGRGFSLEAIRAVIDTWSRGGDLAHLIGFRHLIDAPFSDEEPVELDVEELLDVFPDARDDWSLVQRAVELDMVVVEDDGRVVVPSPMLLDAGRELVRLGVPLAEILDLVELLRDEIQRVADRFLRIVSDYAIGPLVEEADLSPERVSEVTGPLERLRPLAMEIARPFLARSMRLAIDDTVEHYRDVIERAEQVQRDARADRGEAGPA